MTPLAATPSDFRRAFLINFASSSGGAMVHFIVSLLLARLLGPAEMGVYALSLVFVNIAQVFRDFGVSGWLQREPDLTPQKIRAGVGLSACMSALMALALVAGSAPLSRHFGQPEVRPILRVLALGFLPIPFTSAMAALMLREFAAARIAAVSRLGTTAYAVTCLGMAALGFGAMSLAWASLANVVVCCLAYIPLVPKGQSWWPACRNWGGIARFGAGSLLTQTLVTLNQALPDLLLARLGSTVQVGLLGRASSTANLFGTIVGMSANFGALPYLASAHHRKAALAPLLNRSTALLTAVAWPVLALTGLFAGDIVLALFGARWMACVPAVPALALVAAIGMLTNYGGAALAAIGRPDLAAVPVAATALARVGLAAWLYRGDLASFAGIMAAGSLVALPLQLGLNARCLGQSARSMMQAVMPSVVVTLACAGAAWSLARCLPQDLPGVDRLVLSVAAGLVAWFAALHATRHELAAELHRLLRLRITIRK
jgi:O-antigen/teichoic acid export membrane protein